MESPSFSYNYVVAVSLREFARLHDTRWRSSFRRDDAEDRGPVSPKRKNKKRPRTRRRGKGELLASYAGEFSFHGVPPAVLWFSQPAVVNKCSLQFAPSPRATQRERERERERRWIKEKPSLRFASLRFVPDAIGEETRSLLSLALTSTKCAKLQLSNWQFGLPASILIRAILFARPGTRE